MIERMNGEPRLEPAVARLTSELKAQIDYSLKNVVMSHQLVRPSFIE